MSILKYFLNLYRERKQITLLSWAYSAFAIIFVFIAGIFALINQNLGLSMLIIPLVAIIALIGNIVVWALIKLALDTANEKAGVEDNSSKTEEDSKAEKSKEDSKIEKAKEEKTASKKK